MNWPDDYINKIICGDCLEVMKGIPDGAVDLVLTDPPYGIERFKRVGEETKGCFAERGTFKGSELWNNHKPTSDYWAEMFRLSKHQIIWGGNNFDLPPSEYFVIWDKQQMMPNFAQCEMAYVSMGLKSPAKIFPYSIMRLNSTGRIHPTQKPLELFKWCVSNHTAVGAIILDPYLGSGTTCVAAKQLGRKFIGIEINPDYCKIAEDRLRQEELF